jgi:16S rRNA (cytosine967-C5)-methyltransferase
MREENEERIEAFLKNHPEFVPDNLEGVLPDALKNRVQNKGMLQLFPPVDGMEGFFICRLRLRQ